MKSSLKLLCSFWLASAASSLPVLGQMTITGSSMALRSTGSGSDSWTLDRNGYLGTYINVAAPGTVTVRVDAAGTASGGLNPKMNIVLADTKAGFEVTSGTNAYEHSFDLPAGTYFLRTELNNDLEASSRALTVDSVTVSGATVLNSSTNANALAAADSYVQNFRRGGVTLGLSGVAPGTDVGVKLKRHAFNFGTAIPNSFTDTFLIDNPPPGSTAANFQQALADSRFNSLTPENAGKWASNEGSRDTVTVSYMDRIMTYAEQHDMRFRQHNLLWGRNPQGGVNQQPTWSDDMLQNPNGTDGMSGNTNSVALRDEISERIDYYVGDRAHRYYEVDIYNESYHTGSNQNHASNTYWDVYGPSGIASIYKESKDAVAAVGANAKIFINEYNVLQNEGGDLYANWYVRHHEAIQNAGRTLYGEDVVGGIGFQYYASSFGGSGHNPARIYAVMQNLAVQGLPMHLTEFGISSGTTNQTTQASILDEALRLVFGMPDTTGFTMWGFWAGSVWTGAPNGVLYNQDWELRPTGTAWNNLQSQWSTNLSLEVGADGTISFDGFWGDYELTIGGQTYDLTLTKAQSLYSLPIAPGDFNSDGLVDAADFVVWRSTLGSTTDLRADGDGSLIIDDGDFDVWRSLFGMQYNLGSRATPVPEPHGFAMLISLLLAAMLRFMNGPRIRR